MARSTFGGTTADTVAQRVRILGHDVDDYTSATLTVWSAATGGTQYTDLLVNGAASNSVPVDSTGQVPEFQGPDGVTIVWVSAGGARVKMLPAEGPGDSSVAAYVNDSASSTRASLSATYAPRTVYPARLLAKVAAGIAVKVTVLGDSVLQGSTATTPGTDDAVSLFCTTLASRYGVTVTKSNRSQGGRTSAQERIDMWTAALADNADLYVIGITGKNDIAKETGTATGYLTTDSLGEIESEIRDLMVLKPSADIMIVSGNPYGTVYGSTNTRQKAFSDGLARLAAAYGLPYADGWNAVPRAAGDPNAADSAYLSDEVHPNSAGHAKIADAMKALIPASFDPTLAPAASLRNALPPTTTTRSVWRRDRRGILTLTGQSLTAHTDRILNPGFTGTWTGSGPWTSSTANSKANFMAKCSEAFLQFTFGAGQGVVTIYANGRPVLTNLDLSTLQSDKWVSVNFGRAGVNHLTVKVISGTVTLSKIAYASASGEFVDANAARITVTNPGTITTSTSNQYGLVTHYTTTTTVFAFSFVGTALGVALSRGSSGGGAYWSNFTLDGVTQTTPTLPTDFEGTGIHLLTSGLAYGLHTVSLTFQAGIDVGGFSILDETAVLHPTVCEGMAKVGETVRFPFNWSDTPSVTVTSTTANAAGASTVTASSFLVTGTAGDLVRWRASSEQRAIH